MTVRKRSSFIPNGKGPLAVLWVSSDHPYGMFYFNHLVKAVSAYLIVNYCARTSGFLQDQTGKKLLFRAMLAFLEGFLQRNYFSSH
jgi:hypothetical protein